MVVGRFVVLSLAGSFVGLFALSMGLSFVRSLGTGGRPLIRLCSFGAGEVRSFVLSSVLPFSGSFVPHIGCTVGIFVFLLVEQEERK